jgi:hypothetical protein
VTAAEEFLDRADALAVSATVGPWQTGGTPRTGGTYFGTVFDPDDPQEPGVLLGTAATEPDAEFIAAARTDWPKANAALRAVLTGHREAGSTPEGWAGRCAHDGYRWPCPTVRAITDALRVES